MIEVKEKHSNFLRKKTISKLFNYNMKDDISFKLSKKENIKDYVNKKSKPFHYSYLKSERNQNRLSAKRMAIKNYISFERRCDKELRYFIESGIKNEKKFKRIEDIKYLDFNKNIKLTNFFGLEDFKIGIEKEIIQGIEDCEIYYEYNEESVDLIGRSFNKLSYEICKYAKDNDITIFFKYRFLSNSKIIFIKNIDYYLLMDY